MFRINLQIIYNNNFLIGGISIKISNQKICNSNLNLTNNRTNEQLKLGRKHERRIGPDNTQLRTETNFEK